MKPLDVQDLLEYARAAVAVLRALEIADRTMGYGEFARAIGLISDSDSWQPWHRQQVAIILNIVAATELRAGQKAKTERLNYKRVINKITGKPGAGVKKNSRIIRE